MELRLALKHIIFLLIPIILISKQADDFEQKTEIRFIRVFGGDNEKEPPIIILDNPDGKFTSPVGNTFVTIEFDIQADVPPNLYAKFVHCSADWQENENVFLNDIIHSRTTQIDWIPAPISNGYYSYRGIIKVPNIQVKFKFAGNWKMKLYETYNDSIPLAEARFFVVKPKAQNAFRVYTDFYDPIYNFIPPSSVTLESTVYGEQNLFDGQLNTVVIYRNNRWFEPFYISNNSDIKALNSNAKYYYPTMVAGFVTAGKIFRIERIPAENEYRVLNLSDMASFPNTKAAVRKPLADFRRRGDYFDRDDDGALITHFIADYNDNYVTVEFLLDPDNWISIDEVYISGSFNNWRPTPKWQMYYDPDDRYYRLRQIVKRGRHNYMYATGRLNVTTGFIEKLAYDEFEGNTSTNSHTYISFVYYREFDYGGYDALIAVAASSVYGSVKRF